MTHLGLLDVVFVDNLEDDWKTGLLNHNDEYGHLNSILSTFQNVSV